MEPLIKPVSLKLRAWLLFPILHWPPSQSLPLTHLLCPPVIHLLGGMSNSTCSSEPLAEGSFSSLAMGRKAKSVSVQLVSLFSLSFPPLSCIQFP